VIAAAQTRTVDPDITIVQITGRLNLGNLLHSIETSMLKLVKDGTRKMVVDLSALDYIDSAGVGMLIGTNGQMEQAGGKLRIAGAKGLVAQSFGIVHMDRIVALDADVDASIGALQS
jgi:anti-sigma B factor antagonist